MSYQGYVGEQADWREPSSDIRLIGLTGYMGVGKDAAAALLFMLGFHRRAFADALRDEVASFLSRPGELEFPGFPEHMPLRLEELLQEYRLPVNRSIPDPVWQKPTPPAMREILQLWGTEYRRRQDPDYWTRKVLFNLPAKTVISDLRFPNEAQAVRDKGGVIWRIVRRSVEATSDHSSERLQENIKVDATIDNNGTLYQLAFKLKKELKL
jgi:hypothetical protein